MSTEEAKTQKVADETQNSVSKQQVRKYLDLANETYSVSNQQAGKYLDPLVDASLMRGSQNRKRYRKSSSQSHQEKIRTILTQGPMSITDILAEVPFTTMTDTSERVRLQAVLNKIGTSSFWKEPTNTTGKRQLFYSLLPGSEPKGSTTRTQKFSDLRQAYVDARMALKRKKLDNDNLLRQIDKLNEQNQDLKDANKFLRQNNTFLREAS